MRYIYILFITLLLLGSYFPRFSAIDIIGPQWLYLSVINGLVFLFLIKKNKFIHYSFIKKISEIKYFSFFLILSLFSATNAINLSEFIVTISNYFLLLITFIHFFILLELYYSNHNKFPLEFILFLALSFDITEPIALILNDFILGEIDFGAKRYYGLAYNINILAFSILIKIPILLYFILNGSKYVRILSVIFYILSIITLTVLGTRSAIYSLIIIIISIIISIITREKKATFLLIPIVIPIFLAPLILSLSTKEISSKIINNATSIIDKKDSSLNYRINFYKHSINSIIENPLVGIGVGNWKILSIKYDKENLEEYTVPYHAHNDFLQITAEGGILAGLSYILIYLTFMYTTLKKYFFEKKNIILYIAILPLFIFLVDSNLNFPIARPISIIFILFLIPYTKYYLQNEKIH